MIPMENIGESGNIAMGICYGLSVHEERRKLAGV